MENQNENAGAPLETGEGANPFEPPQPVADWNVGPSFCGAVAYCWARAFDFKSRANRTEYWGWLVGSAFVFSAASVLVELCPEGFWQGTARILLWIVFLASLLPGTAVSIRRARDFGRSWGWAAIFPLWGVLWIVLWSVALNAELIKFPSYAPAASRGFPPFAGFPLGFGLNFFSAVVGLCGCAREWWNGAWGSLLSMKCEILFCSTFFGALVGIALRCWFGLWRGTPGPNRFGDERLTPREAARRRDAAKRAEERGENENFSEKKHKN